MPVCSKRKIHSSCKHYLFLNWVCLAGSFVCLDWGCGLFVRGEKSGHGVPCPYERLDVLRPASSI